MGGSVAGCAVSIDSTAVGSEVTDGFVDVTGGADVLVQLASKATKIKASFVRDIVSPGSKAILSKSV
jgi:hypothetical protein